MQPQEFIDRRLNLGLTQAELAKSLNTWCGKRFGKPGGYTDKRISNFERGERSIPPRVEWFMSDICPTISEGNSSP
jgi:transcriptional regulator with XRE-family HTH domain